MVFICYILCALGLCPKHAPQQPILKFLFVKRGKASLYREQGDGLRNRNRLLVHNLFELLCITHLSIAELLLWHSHLKRMWNLKGVNKMLLHLYHLRYSKLGYFE